MICFVNAGDPDLDATFRILTELDRLGVYGVELCIPYGNPFTDGETIRRSHARALAHGITLDQVLERLAEVRPSLSLRIFLMADWSYSVAPIGCDEFMRKAAGCGVDGVLLHALPPVKREGYLAASRRHAVPVVSTIYAGAEDRTVERAVADCTGFIYAVSRYGTAGTAVSFDQPALEAIRAIRCKSDKPVFVGFGVNTHADVAAVMSTGVDGVVIGSAFVKAIEQCRAQPSRLPAAIEEFIAGLSRKEQGK